MSIKSVFSTMGASNHSSKKRADLDFYATDPIAIDILVKNYPYLNKKIWENAVGMGHLAERLKKYGYDVVGSDIVDRGYPNTLVIDFLKDGFGKYKKILSGRDIVTNPPYKHALEWAKKSLELLEQGNNLCLFLRLLFLEGKKRKQFFLENPPKYVMVSSSRILCAKNAEFDETKASGSSAVAFAWFIWQKGYKGETTIKWVN